MFLFSVAAVGAARKASRKRVLLYRVEPFESSLRRHLFIECVALRSAVGQTLYLGELSNSCPTRLDSGVGERDSATRLCFSVQPMSNSMDTQT